jgi:hypothetical protein
MKKSFIKYLEYYRDNPEGYWFKRKIFGWGWMPVRPQGWAVIVIFIAFMFWNALSMQNEANIVNDGLPGFFVKMLFALIVLFLICYKKGEKPGWQWGLKDK